MLFDRDSLMIKKLQKKAELVFLLTIIKSLVNAPIIYIHLNQIK